MTTDNHITTKTRDTVSYAMACAEFLQVNTVLKALLLVQRGPEDDVPDHLVERRWNATIAMLTAPASSRADINGKLSVFEEYEIAYCAAQEERAAICSAIHADVRRLLLPAEVAA